MMSVFNLTSDHFFLRDYNRHVQKNDLNKHHRHVEVVKRMLMCEMKSNLEESVVLKRLKSGN